MTTIKFIKNTIIISIQNISRSLKVNVKINFQYLLKVQKYIITFELENDSQVKTYR